MQIVYGLRTKVRVNHKVKKHSGRTYLPSSELVLNVGL